MALQVTMEEHKKALARRWLVQRPAAELVERYLDGMTRRGELIPGATAAIQAIVARRGPLAEHQFAELGKLFAEGGEGYLYLNPEYRSDAPEAPLRAILARFQIGAAKTGELYNRHAVEFSRHPLATLPEAVLCLLHRPEYMSILGGPDEPRYQKSGPPDVPPGAKPIEDILAHLRGRT